MKFTEQQLSGFGVALNEATLLGIEVVDDLRRVTLTFATLALPAGDGPAPEDPTVRIVLEPVGRIAASLRHGTWDDEHALVEPFELEHLEEIVEGFGQQAVYGWEFLDVPDEDDFARWEDRLSLDWDSGFAGGDVHTLDLFQEGGFTRHLDLRLWFDELRVIGADERELSIKDFAAAGRRWWDGLHGGDPRTTGQGIVAQTREN